MSVYKHQQGNYRSYRVARSVDGKLCQEYFPRTRKGYQEAKKRDEELARDQERAQQFFTGPALRWQKKDAKSARNGVVKASRQRVQPRLLGSKAATTARASKTAAQAKSAPRRASKKTTTIKAAPKRVNRSKQTARAAGRTRG